MERLMQLCGLHYGTLGEDMLENEPEQLSKEAQALANAIVRGLIEAACDESNVERFVSVWGKSAQQYVGKGTIKFIGYVLLIAATVFAVKNDLFGLITKLFVK